MTIKLKFAASVGWSVGLGAVLYGLGYATHGTLDADTWNAGARGCLVSLWCMSSLVATSSVFDGEDGQ